MARYGHLTVAIGPMFAGKTTELLRQANLARDLGLQYVIIKPALDKRYSETEVVSHDGVSLPCVSTSTLPTISDANDIVFIDEVQFFGMEIIPWVADLLSRDIDVRAHGLDLDWMGTPFVVSGALAAMADHVLKLHARCDICGVSASKTFKKEAIAGSVDIGAKEKYEPRCNEHWSRKTAAPVADLENSSISQDLVALTRKYAQEIKNGRTPADIYSHFKSELQEFEEEWNGAKGVDGLFGEAIDLILCLLDLIIVAHPEMSDSDIHAYALKKLEKWKRRYGGSIEGDRSIA